MKLLRFGAIALLALSLPATALPITSTETSTRDTLDIEFTPGTGNPNTDFAITRVTEEFADGENVVEIGLKAKQRFIGQTNVGGTGTIYEVEPGFSVADASGTGIDPTRAWWNFDFSYDLGERSLADSLVILEIMDPQGDMFELVFNDVPDIDTSLSILQNSWNIAFSFIAGPLGGFEPTLTGDYIITASVLDLQTEALIGSQAITARVIPVPAPLALIGLGLLALGAVRRRA